VATSLVDGAGFVGGVVLFDPLEGVVSRPSVAPKAIQLTGEKELWSDVDVRPCSFASNLNSVGKGRCGSLGPA